MPKKVRRTFSLMKYRCETITSPDYPKWGGAGISVEYADVFDFYKDVGDKPTSNHSIDRINGRDNYKVGNCRWATAEEQCNNFITNRIITIDDVSYTVARASRKYNIGYTTLKQRLDSGMSHKDAVFKPVKKYNYDET